MGKGKNVYHIAKILPTLLCFNHTILLVSSEKLIHPEMEVHVLPCFPDQRKLPNLKPHYPIKGLVGTMDVPFVWWLPSTEPSLQGVNKPTRPVELLPV